MIYDTEIKDKIHKMLKMLNNDKKKLKYSEWFK